MSYDMEMVGKLHSRPAVLKCFRLRTLTLQISLTLLLLGSTLLDQLANYGDICFYRVHKNSFYILSYFIYINHHPRLSPRGSPSHQLP